jgi:hypothetical protein
MKPQTGGELGPHMDKMGGILDLHWNITGFTRYTSPSAQDLATQAAAELTHALLHPQPAGPFCKVGDEQTIALKRLTDIFEGRHTTEIKSCYYPHQRGVK